ncbi:MAG TPA: DUF433 domain-containing protein [Tepidisphaeraceae bacterium]|nr:DUF433 domain-containing protein [Tepidisphaeraceae bacterium]
MSDTQTYVATDQDGVMRVGKTRVMLDSVAAAYGQGHSPESIRAQYPSLTLEEVYGAITYMLAHSEEVSVCLKRQEETWERFRAKADENTPAVVERLRAAKRSVEIGGHLSFGLSAESIEGA